MSDLHPAITSGLDYAKRALDRAEIEYWGLPVGSAERCAANIELRLCRLEYNEMLRAIAKGDER